MEAPGGGVTETGGFLYPEGGHGDDRGMGSHWGGDSMIRLAGPSSPQSLRARGARSNDWLADRLQEVGDLLEAQGADRFRVRAWREGALALRRWERDAARVFRAQGRRALEEVGGIGPSLSSAIAEILSTGRLRLLDRLRGTSAPEEVFSTLPGVGPELAHRIHHDLHAESLEELERAAWDGRLEEVRGFGPRRVEVLKAVLAQRLAARGPSGWRPSQPEPRPSVLELLSVDREYRQKAQAGELQRIAPRRFNPHRAAWLPILHTERGPWAFHALFSNTGQAHRLGKTRDWVVLYYSRDGEEGQATVVTETRGPLAGERVVRGREEECAALHGSAAGAAPGRESAP
jgi:hypothetical protein